MSTLPTIDDRKKTALIEALERYKGQTDQVKKAAKALGIARKTAYLWIERYNLGDTYLRKPSSTGGA